MKKSRHMGKKNRDQVGFHLVIFRMHMVMIGWEKKNRVIENFLK